MMNKIFKLLAVFMLFATLSAGSMTVQAETATNVAQVGDTDYATLAEAIAAANEAVTSGTENVVITLLADITLDTAEVTIGDNITLNLGGKTLNLNGKTLNVYGLVSVGGNVVDNSENRDGLLKLGSGSCEFSSDNSQVPVYNTAKGGYAFATMTEQVHRSSDPSADTFKLIFKPDFGAVNALLANGSADARVSIGINLEWTGGTQPLVYTDSIVQTVYDNDGKAFYIELTGFSNVDNLTITPIVKSELGTTWSKSKLEATDDTPAPSPVILYSDNFNETTAGDKPNVNACTDQNVLTEVRVVENTTTKQIFARIAKDGDNGYLRMYAAEGGQGGGPRVDYVFDSAKVQDMNMTMTLKVKSDGADPKILVYCTDSTNPSATLGPISATDWTDVRIELDFKQNKATVYVSGTKTYEKTLPMQKDRTKCEIRFTNTLSPGQAICYDDVKITTTQVYEAVQP